MNSEKIIDLLIKSKALLVKTLNVIYKSILDSYMTRESYKKIIRLSIQDDLYARGNEVNSVFLRFKSIKWVFVGFLYYLLLSLFSLSIVTVSITLVGLTIIFVLFWDTPQSLVKTHCNRILGMSVKKLENEINGNEMLLSLVQLMKDLEAVGLSGKHTADSSGFKRISFDKLGDITVIHFEQEGKVKNIKLTNWNQSEFQMCYVIPQIYDSLSDAHLVLHSKFTVSLSHYATQDWDGFTEF